MRDARGALCYPHTAAMLPQHLKPGGPPLLKLDNLLPPSVSLCLLSILRADPPLRSETCSVLPCGCEAQAMCCPWVLAAAYLRYIASLTSLYLYQHAAATSLFSSPPIHPFIQTLPSLAPSQDLSEHPFSPRHYCNREPARRKDGSLCATQAGRWEMGLSSSMTLCVRRMKWTSSI